MFEFFGGRQRGFKSRSVQARTVEELEAILTDSDFIKSDCIQLCEIYVPKFDVPWILRGQVDAHKARLKAASEEQKKAWESLAAAGKFT
ncbi:hypothetical protein ABW19_dt0201777 [Dactylella cylindrospora]|nr:hypothetical protein ABW19_dt0201777 [Dactylella cylindrospora]